MTLTEAKEFVGSGLAMYGMLVGLLVFFAGIGGMMNYRVDWFRLFKYIGIGFVMVALTLVTIVKALQTG